MVCVGIDVAKDKHDCFILSSEGEVLADVFTVENKTVVLVLCHINSNANHDDTSRVKIYDAASTKHFAL